MTVTPQDTVPAVDEQATHTEPIHYGWRFVRRDLPDGNYTVEQIPLSLEDVLHPEEGDQVTHSGAHQRRWRYLCNVFNARLIHDPTAVVLDDVRIKWDNPDIKPHGPDIMVIFGVRERKNWSTFNVAEEGTRPTLIVEMTSPETRTIDFVSKRDEYEFANVPLYVIVDSLTRRGEETLRLYGYTLTPNGYQALAPDAQGRLWLEAVGLWLGIHKGDVYCTTRTAAGLAITMMLQLRSPVHKLHSPIHRLRSLSNRKLAPPLRPAFANWKRSYAN